MTAAALIEEATLADADESALARRFAQGDAAAFDEVVARYQPRVARLAHRLLGWRGDAEDVVQDVFLTALRKSRSFRGDSSLGTWLSAITINRCRRHLRRTTLFRRFLSWSAKSPPTASPPADRASLDAEVSRRVREAVVALPPRDREVIVLYYLEQCPVAEMSQLLNAAPNAIQVRLHRARARLAAALSEFVTE